MATAASSSSSYPQALVLLYLYVVVVVATAAAVVVAAAGEEEAPLLLLQLLMLRMIRTHVRSLFFARASYYCIPVSYCTNRGFLLLFLVFCTVVALPARQHHAGWVG